MAQVKSELDVIASQIKAEEHLVENMSPCIPSKLESIKDNFHSLKDDELESIVRESFFNENAMKTAQCAINSLFYTSPYDFGGLSIDDKITTYIRNLRKIGGETTEGEAFVADFGKAQDLFVIKSPKHKVYDRLIHELVVGLYGTNKLRKYIPNFSYVYGGFKCSPPVYNGKTKKIINWCEDGPEKVNYVLYENITPSLPLPDYIKTCTGKEFLNVYMQILYSLRLAYDISDFTHYDLHNENILIRLTNHTNFQIPYETENKKVEYLQSKVIATFIDYGFAHITVPDMTSKTGEVIPTRHYGYHNMQEYEVYADRSWVLGDLYKILMYCANVAQYYKNTEVMEVCRMIYSYFYTNTIEEALRLGAEQYYTLPYNGSVDQFEVVDALAKHIRSKLDCDFITNKSSAPVLNCKTALCENEDVIYDRIGLGEKTDISVPNDIVEFSILITRLQAQNKLPDALKLASFYDYKNHIKEAIQNLGIASSEIVENLSGIVPSEPTDIVNMTSSKALKIRAMYYGLAEVFAKVRKMKILYNMSIIAANFYDDRKGKEDIELVMGKFFTASGDKLQTLMNSVTYNNTNPQSYDVNSNSVNWVLNKGEKFENFLIAEYQQYVILRREFLLR